MLCELCQTDAATSLHHLIPRTLHSNKWFKRRYSRQQMQQGIDLCGDCHRAIHRTRARRRTGRAIRARARRTHASAH